MSGPTLLGPALAATGRKREHVLPAGAKKKCRRCRWKARSAPIAGSTTPTHSSSPKPDSICVDRDGHLLVSSGSDVLLIRDWGQAPERWASFDAPVSALAVSGGGQVAIGLAGGRLVVRGPSGENSPGWTPSSHPRAIVDCLFLSEDDLAVVDHGYGPGEPVLSLAPWDDAARGQVIAISRGGATRVIAAGLHCPMGIARAPDGSLVLTELEHARVIDATGKVLQSGYPAYLARIREVGGGYAIACLSRRDPLIEFLKTEHEFVARMKGKYRSAALDMRRAPILSSVMSFLSNSARPGCSGKSNLGRRRSPTAW